MYEACLLLPHNRREAGLIAEQLEALGRALREWPAEAWRQVAAPRTVAPTEHSATTSPTTTDSLFERLIARTAPAVIDTVQRQRALVSVETVAAVLRVLWPEAPAPTDSAAALTAYAPHEAQPVAAL